MVPCIAVWPVRGDYHLPGGRRRVTFPDGTRVYGSPFRSEHSERADFGLYLDSLWSPPWAHECIEWPDFDVPTNTADAIAKIVNAFERARAGQVVEVGCLGGRGRTGTVLACMAVLAGVPPFEAVAWVRTHYDSHAVETRAQEAFVFTFAAARNLE